MYELNSQGRPTYQIGCSVRPTSLKQVISLDIFHAQLVTFCDGGILKN